MVAAEPPPHVIPVERFGPEARQKDGERIVLSSLLMVGLRSTGLLHSSANQLDRTLTETTRGSSPAESQPGLPMPHPWAANLALGFLMVSLLALVLIPVLVQRHIDGLRDELDHVVEPARSMVIEIHYYLARQMSALRGYMVAEDPVFLDTYHVLVQEEEVTRQELRPLAERLGPDVLRGLVRLEVLSEQWHERGTSDLDALRDPDADPRVEADLYDDLLATATALDEAISVVSAEYQTAIRDNERLSLYLTIGLVLLAVGAALVAGWLGRRVRVLADAAAKALGETRGVIEERSRLLRGITHDVKNPLGAADGYAQLLESGMEPLSPRQEQWVKGLRRSLRGTLVMIDDLLHFERAGSADVVIRRDLVELGPLVRDTAAEHGGAVRSAGHSLEAETPPEPIRVWTDAGRVRQILGNLLSNAIKYTPPPGHIRLLLEMVETEGDGTHQGLWAVVRVADSGPGIPENEHERIFQEFHRLDYSGAEGHGLGLAISRRLAELLNARLTVESASGQGSVFSLWLPLRAQEQVGD